MAEWPASPNVIGKRIPRLDGLLKASGKAKYPSDVRPEGTLFGVMLYSPYAHARVKSIDLTPAEKMPGVKAVIAIVKAGATLRYHGDDVAAVAAETEEQARDAIRAIKVEYEVLPARRDRGPLDGRRGARGLPGRQRPPGPERDPRACPTRLTRRSRRRSRIFPGKSRLASRRRRSTITSRV